MVYELTNILAQAHKSHLNGEKCVLASVVHLDGTSYRKPGVRMLITESGKTIGAVSGGCVEKDICHRAQWVFANEAPKVMTYDGRLRLGCEGTLYILLEPIEITTELLTAYHTLVQQRKPITMRAWYMRGDNATGAFGSVVQLGKKQVQFRKSAIDTTLESFKQTLNPALKLLILGAEHDAVKLCTTGANLGWEVTVVSSWRDPKTKADFAGAKEVLALSPELLDPTMVDANTAVVLMTHNYALDLQYLLQLKENQLTYLGVLGSQKRNNRLNDAFYEQTGKEMDIFGPIGLDIGAETPEEIATAIAAEILAVFRKKNLNAVSSLSQANRSNHEIQ